MGKRTTKKATVIATEAPATDTPVAPATASNLIVTLADGSTRPMSKAEKASHLRQKTTYKGAGPDTIKVLSAGNPKRQGSEAWQRFELLVNAAAPLTVAEFIEGCVGIGYKKGHALADITWGENHGQLAMVKAIAPVELTFKPVEPELVEAA